ncbi:MAG: phospholipid carrier-dependent glycosyltransferase [Anaerolineales bacterium]|nr:phospholipid carrier-dependent glycosyltransferase [Anaerolineales bacterium]
MPGSRRVWQHPLLWLLCVSCALTIANGLILPSFEAMDEPEHFQFARYLAEGRGLPDQRDLALAVDYGYRQEGGQAPLYHLFSALVLRLLGEDVSDVDALTVPNPLSTCGDLTQSHNKGMWLRNPERERFPYRGAALGVHVLRLFGSIWVMLTVVGVYRTARLVFPGLRQVGLLAAALVGLNPRFLVHAGTMTNDVLLAALAAWVIYFAVAILRWGPSWRRSVALGILLGLAALTKASGAMMLSLVGLALADWTWRNRAGRRGLAHAFVIGALLAVIAGWWYVGNLVRYGSPGLMPLFTRETGLREGWPPYLVIPEIGNFLRSYWAASGYCELRLGLYPVYVAISLVGLVGVIYGVRRAPVDVRRAAMLLAVWIGTTFAAWLRFNAVVWAPEGRYWFQAHAAIAPLLAAGLLYLFGRWPSVWRALVAALGILAIGTSVEILAPLFGLPPRQEMGDVAASHLLEADFGDQVALVGYDVEQDSLRAGDSVDLTLFLTAQHPVTESLMLGVAARGGRAH